MRTCIVGLVSLLRDVRVPHEYLHLVSHPSRPSVLFLPCHFFFLSVACTLSSFCAERKCATEKRGISPELTVTCANGRVRKIYLLEPNILRSRTPVPDLTYPTYQCLWLRAEQSQRAAVFRVARLLCHRYAYDYKRGWTSSNLVKREGCIRTRYSRITLRLKYFCLLQQYLFWWLSE